MLLDYISATVSLSSTLLFIERHPLAWLTGLAATVLNGILYHQSGIYAETGLEIFYGLSCLYGYWRWRQLGFQDKAHQIIPLSAAHLLGISLMVVILYSGLYYLLKTTTPSTVPHLDATTTSLSIIGQLLMCYKHIATWLIWFIADSIYVLLYIKKGLSAHVMLMVVYLFMAVAGFYRWQRALKRP